MTIRPPLIVKISEPLNFANLTWIDSPLEVKTSNKTLRVPLVFRYQNPLRSNQDHYIHDTDFRLIGKDKLPRIYYRWPRSPNLPVYRDLYSWNKSFNPTLISKDKFFGLAGNTTFGWANPQFPTYLNSGFIDSGNALNAAIKAPFNQDNWPNPNQVLYREYSWVDYNIPAGQDKLPAGSTTFFQNLPFSYYPVPKGGLYDWQWFIIPAGQDKLPENQYNWPVPQSPIPPVRDWQEYLNPPAFPKVSGRFEVPSGPPPNSFWIDYTIPAGQDKLPSGNTNFFQNIPFSYYPVLRGGLDDWQYSLNLDLVTIQVPLDRTPVFVNPTLSTIRNLDWQEFVIPAGQDSLPIGERRFDVPYGPTPPVKDWVEYLNPPGFPNVSKREEVPLGPPPNPFWIDYTIPVGQDVLPTRTNVPNPTLPILSNRDWQYFTLKYPVFNFFPSNIWFVPTGAQPKVTDWVEYTVPAGQDVLPKNQYSWPVPKGPERYLDWQEFLNPPAFPTILSTDKVPYGSPPSPFWVYFLNPPAFPTVTRREEVPYGPPPNSFWINYTIPAGQDVLPFGRNYEINPTLPILPNKDWQDYVIPVGQDFLPNRQLDWPLPPISASPKIQDWQLSLDPNLLVIVNPKTGQIFFVPTGPTTNPSWINYTIPAGQDILPFRTDTHNPVLSILPNKDWISLVDPNLLIVLNPAVANQTIVPYGPTINPSWISYIIPAGQDSLPVGDHTFNVPYGAAPPPKDWVEFLNPPAFPSVLKRLEVPLGPPPNPYWTNYIVPAGQDSLPFRTDTRNPTLSTLPIKDWLNSLNLNIVVVTNPRTGQVFFVPVGPTTNPTFQNYVVPAGQDSTVFGRISETNPVILIPRSTADWVNFLTNIPPPLPPAAIISSGRYITEAEEKESVSNPWRYKEGLDTLYRHMAAVALGQKGGQAYASNLRKR